MRYLFGFICVCALGAMPLVGCGEDESECQQTHQGRPGNLPLSWHCDDEDECTHDLCPEGECMYEPVDCTDRDLYDCEIPLGCEPEVGCVFTNKPDGSSCGGTDWYCMFYGGGFGFCRDDSCVCE